MEITIDILYLFTYKIKLIFYSPVNGQLLINLYT